MSSSVCLNVIQYNYVLFMCYLRYLCAIDVPPICVIYVLPMCYLCATYVLPMYYRCVTYVLVMCHEIATYMLFIMCRATYVLLMFYL